MCLHAVNVYIILYYSLTCVLWLLSIRIRVLSCLSGWWSQNLGCKRCVDILDTEGVSDVCWEGVEKCAERTVLVTRCCMLACPLPAPAPLLPDPCQPLHTCAMSMAQGTLSMALSLSLYYLYTAHIYTISILSLYCTPSKLHAAIEPQLSQLQSKSRPQSYP